MYKMTSQKPLTIGSFLQDKDFLYFSHLEKKWPIVWHMTSNRTFRVTRLGSALTTSATSGVARMAWQGRAGWDDKILELMYIVFWCSDFVEAEPENLEI